MILKNFWLLLILPFVLGVLFWVKKTQKSQGIQFSSHSLLPQRISWRMRLQYVPMVLRYLAVILFVVALSGPRMVKEETVRNVDAVDIVLAIDVSGSMAAEDFMVAGKRQNRLTVVKDVVKQFIDMRQYDQIGLIAFAKRAYTVAPMTTDYGWLHENLKRVQLYRIEDGTAVGSAIMAGVSRLEDSQASSRMIILLTDGVNNEGNIDPVLAARVAQEQGIKVYTIGAGTKGEAPIPAFDRFGRKVYRNYVVQIDEASLKEVAKITNARYFRATDTQSLRDIYKEIDALEKTRVEQIGYFQYEELFQYPLILALCFLLIEFLLTHWLVMRLPG